MHIDKRLSVLENIAFEFPQRQRYLVTLALFQECQLKDKAVEAGLLAIEALADDEYMDHYSEFDPLVQNIVRIALAKQAEANSISQGMRNSAHWTQKTQERIDHLSCYAAILWRLIYTLYGREECRLSCFIDCLCSLRDLNNDIATRRIYYIASDVLYIYEPSIAPDKDVEAMANDIYQNRSFDDMPILADALEDSGCADQRVLKHLRKPRLHVRGCWVLERILGKP